MDFEWDLRKEVENVRKHSVSFSEAAEAFSDPKGLSLRDDKHSTKEERLFWIGLSNSKRVLTVRYTKRGTVIRIFSAAEWREFRELYYAKTKNK